MTIPMLVVLTIAGDAFIVNCVTNPAMKLSTVGNVVIKQIILLVVHLLVINHVRLTLQIITVPPLFIWISLGMLIQEQPTMLLQT